MIGTVLAQRYRLESVLGSGGSSQVYRATDLTTSEPVAVKLLDQSAAADAALRALFIREARTLAGLSHPNIVPIHGGGEADGTPFIVMELVEGPSLADLIARGPLPLADATRIAAAVLEALVFAHAKGIVHADLKPANVLLTLDERVKVCDFGIARSPREDDDAPTLVASARYIAPERVEGRGVTASTDVYGAGLLLYEMLVGRPPFTSGQTGVLMRDHLLRAPIPPSHLRPSLSRRVDDVVMRALAKKPELRFASAAELAAALDAATRPSSQVMVRPIADFVPRAAESPVVAMLSTHGTPIRSTFFGALAALPYAALTLLAGFGVPVALLGSALVLAIAVLGRLGPALAVAWAAETVLLFLFVPGLAVLFALMGLWVYLRDLPPERAAIALAMPVAAPFGFGPALALACASIFGLAGVATAAWGATLAVLAGIAVGRPSYGPYVSTGLPLERESLLDPSSASGTEAAFINLVRNTDDRFGALREALDPPVLVRQVVDLASRVSGADIALIATVLSWAAAALTVWALTRVLRTAFDALLRRRAPWFALYVFATGAGAAAGGLLLYLLFVTWSPLVRTPGRPADELLLAWAIGGAIIALAVGVVIAAVERREPEPQGEPLIAGLGGGRVY